MKDVTKKYTNSEVTIVWKPEVCMHSGNCFRGLDEVFDPHKRPWVTPDGSTSDRIVEQVKKCPSGALSYYMNQPELAAPASTEQGTVIEPTPNGPLLVSGDLHLRDSTGALTKMNSKIALCRCGASANKPYCDGSHREINFKG